MSLFLGINFGHDASLCLMREGNILSFRELERYSGLKHQVGISSCDLTNFLIDAGVAFSNIDIIALTGTQFYTARHSSTIQIRPLNPKVILGAQSTNNWYGYSHHKSRLGEFSESVFPDRMNTKNHSLESLVCILNDYFKYLKK